jgi:hypothetical protein
MRLEPACLSHFPTSILPSKNDADHVDRQRSAQLLDLVLLAVVAICRCGVSHRSRPGRVVALCAGRLRRNALRFVPGELVESVYGPIAIQQNASAYQFAAASTAWSGETSAEFSAPTVTAQNQPRRAKDDDSCLGNTRPSRITGSSMSWSVKPLWQPTIHTLRQLPRSRQIRHWTTGTRPDTTRERS